MPGEDIEAYVRMGIDERARRRRRDNPQKWRTSKIALALATYRSEARQQRAPH